jgi:(p)ppGpp synthase/HD superfamily hydrolase
MSVPNTALALRHRQKTYCSAARSRDAQPAFSRSIPELALSKLRTDLVSGPSGWPDDIFDDVLTAVAGRYANEAAQGKIMNDWIVVLRAAEAAARWHVRQKRKGTHQEPYINHLLEVANLVAAATQGNDVDVIIAALLHDTIEDPEVPREIIERKFGARVASLVEEVSDDRQLPKEERKRQQVETAHQKSDDAKRIKLADKISNLRAITYSPPADWSVKRRLEYVLWAKAVVAGLRGISPWLEEQFDRAVAEAERSLDFSAGASIG